MLEQREGGDLAAAVQPGTRAGASHHIVIVSTQIWEVCFHGGPAFSSNAHRLSNPQALNLLPIPKPYSDEPFDGEGRSPVEGHEFHFKEVCMIQIGYPHGQGVK